MILSHEVEQGLTLAIHLDISDSAITGMGFDALARGMSIFDITYRILLLWKRRTAQKVPGRGYVHSQNIGKSVSVIVFQFY